MFPFPVIIFAAALIGYIGASRGNPAFVAAGHGSSQEDEDSLLGDDMPAHTRTNAKQALEVSAIWLALWLVPVAAILLIAGPRTSLAIAVFFSKMAVVTFGGAYQPGENVAI